MEQVFINLVKNALEAMKNTLNPKLTISTSLLEGKMIISVKDNGMGIEQDKIDDIFIPFYTSKENGSGIGLSLVKQIINLHKGSINVNSEHQVGTEFQIIL